jgi:hypothetical protein
MPYTHWLKIKGTDERWKFLAQYNAIPNRLYNRIMQVETKDGLEKRKLEPDEFHDYVLRTGQIFSESVRAYMTDKEQVAKRGSEIIDREKVNGEIEKINGVREDVEKLWSDAHDDAEMELFRWGSVKEEMPDVWNLIKKNQAYQLYQLSKSINGQALNKSELYEFNNLASIRYAERVKNYLASNRAESDKNKIDKKTGLSRYQERIDNEWADAKQYVTNKMNKRFGKNHNK